MTACPECGNGPCTGGPTTGDGACPKQTAASFPQHEGGNSRKDANRPSSAAQVHEFESMHPDDVPGPIRDEAKRLLGMTIATERGRTFNTAADFAQALYFLAVLTDAPEWDFLRGG